MELCGEAGALEVGAHGCAGKEHRPVQPGLKHPHLLPPTTHSPTMTGCSQGDRLPGVALAASAAVTCILLSKKATSPSLAVPSPTASTPPACGGGRGGGSVAAGACTEQPRRAGMKQEREGKPARAVSALVGEGRGRLLGGLIATGC